VRKRGEISSVASIRGRIVVAFILAVLTHEGLAYLGGRFAVVARHRSAVAWGKRVADDKE